VERSPAALPDDEYLVRFSEIAYTASHLEWTFLGDLHRLADRLPNELVPNRLEPILFAMW
jgi:hypothetical protein